MADEKIVQPTDDKEQLYKAAVDVINQALAEIEEQESFTKTDVNEDPEGMNDEVIDAMADKSPGEDSEAGDPEMEKDLGSLSMSDEDEKEEDEEKPEDEKSEEESNEEVMKAYEKCMEKMKKRGMAKAEVETSTLAKSEPKAKSEVEDLRKTYDSKFEELTKSIERLTAQLEKVASRPAGRKGVTGVQPLKKSEEEATQPSKTRYEIINHLIELQKSGNPEVTPLLIGKVESGALDSRDIEKVRRLIG